MQNKNHIIVLTTAIFTGIASFINWLTTVPPEQQSGMLAQLVEITPVQYRPQVGLATRFLVFGLGIYTLYKASRSGPTQPPNPPSA